MKPITADAPLPPGAKQVPPGIAKKEQQLPPGLLKRVDDLPKGIEARFPRPQPPASEPSPDANDVAGTEGPGATLDIVI